ncbi:sodium/sugar symporter [Pseudoteredinibacter isoporae]|uniref:sodium/sugar symporter n=1 Tax=Pseudoteredinibacter isoporae TaxID=570281 RepID=UPI0031069933
MSKLDVSVFFIYVVVLLAIAYIISREKVGHEKSTKDYFLAGGSLPWWAIGASLIAANISAEQIIGMSGSGFAIGLGIASYEWMAAATLIIVAKYCLPIFLKHGIYTMPEFLEHRFDRRVKTVMAVFWLGVYVFVNLTAIFWLGALAIKTITGVDNLYGMIFLAAFAAAYSLYGGLKAVAFTDIIQVVILVLGGLFLSYISLDMVSEGQGAIAGFQLLQDRVPEKFDMVLDKDHPFYANLPGISVLIGGMWIMNLSYWGFNQYIIQRALAAKTLQEGQKGIMFAAYLKLLMPVIVVLPGIAAAVLLTDLETPDAAYPMMMQFMPEGIKGLVFAALVAAIVSSLGSMTNSISTIFTMDIYAYYRPGKNQKHYVTVGRSVSLFALIVGVLCAKPLLGNFEQAFQYIQEFTGFFTPGIVALFILGMFWKQASANSALAAAIGSALFSLAFKLFWPALPFIDRVGLVFIACVLLAVFVVLVEGKKAQPDVAKLSDMSFATSQQFNLLAAGVVLVLTAFYVSWW